MYSIELIPQIPNRTRRYVSSYRSGKSHTHIPLDYISHSVTLSSSHYAFSNENTQTSNFSYLQRPLAALIFG